MLTRDMIAMNTVLALASAILIATYILFGGPTNDKSSKRKKIKRGIIPGLQNLGNACFLNCILQSLASCHSFTKWLLSNQFNIDPSPLISALGEILYSLNKDADEEAASSAVVMAALYNHGWSISPDEQDAHELFFALMQTMNDELDQIKGSSSSLLNVSWVTKENNSEEISFKRNVPAIVSNVEDKNENGSRKDQENFVIVQNPNSDTMLEDDAMEISPCRKNMIISKFSPSLNQSLPSNSDVLECPFKGSLASHLQCSLCGFKKPKTLSSFNSLSLSIPERPSWFQCTLINLLDEYVRPECITDVTCDGCSRLSGNEFRSIYSKQLTLAKLPDCLCIHIQRTSWTATSSAFKKNDFVFIPQLLNMEPYTYTNTLRQPDALEVQNREANLDEFSAASVGDRPFSGTSHIEWKDSCRYSLKAVVVHEGDLQSGHFYTYRKGSDDSNFKDKWFFASDIQVREVQIDEVLRAHAYMIIYEKFSMQ